MPALALGDEQPPLAEPQVAQPQARGPRSGAARPAPSPRPSPGPGACARRAVSASTSAGVQDPAAASGAPAPAGHPAAAAAAPAGSAGPAAPGSRLTSPRACKNPYSPDTLDSRRRSVRADTPPRPAPPPAGASPPVRCAVMNASTSDGRDPPRRLAHHGEEHLQVIGHSQHRVRPAPASQEPQVLIQQPAPRAAPTQLTARRSATGSGGQQSQACRPPSPRRNRPVSLSRSL